MSRQASVRIGWHALKMFSREYIEMKEAHPAEAVADRKA